MRRAAFRDERRVNRRRLWRWHPAFHSNGGYLSVTSIIRATIMMGGSGHWAIRDASVSYVLASADMSVRADEPLLPIHNQKGTRFVFTWSQSALSAAFSSSSAAYCQYFALARTFGRSTIMKARASASVAIVRPSFRTIGFQNCFDQEGVTGSPPGDDCTRAVALPSNCASDLTQRKR
jgi:hypothetical protein